MRGRDRDLVRPPVRRVAARPATRPGAGRHRRAAAHRPGCAPSTGRTRPPARSPRGRRRGSRRQSSRSTARIVVACSLRRQNATKSCSPRSPAEPAFEQVDVERPGPGQRVPGAQRGGAARRRRTPGTRTAGTGRRTERRRHPVRLSRRSPVRPAASSPASRRTSESRERGPARRRARRRARPDRWRAPRRRCGRPPSARSAGAAEQPVELRLQHAGDGTPAGLRRPAGEVGAVVRDVEPTAVPRTVPDAPIVGSAGPVTRGTMCSGLVVVDLASSGLVARRPPRRSSAAVASGPDVRLVLVVTGERRDGLGLGGLTGRPPWRP